MRRSELSRPVRLAVEDEVINPSRTVLDYGCGHGDDLKFLSRLNVSCCGWDPEYRPDTSRDPADVVNLGYVVNVIENPTERRDTLKSAWSLAKKALIVSARLAGELRESHTRRMGDGFLTQIDTFQKFYEQGELREWIEDSLGVHAVPAAPGVFYIFRHEPDRQAYLASRVRTRRSQPRLMKSEQIFKDNEAAFQPLLDFLAMRGRLPSMEELPAVSELIEQVGSLKRAHQIIRRVSSADEWDAITELRAADLLIYLALLRFEGRPKATQLPLELQLDVKAYCGSYKEACSMADQLLFAAGNEDVVDQACRQSEVGKLTPPAIYAHVKSLSYLPPVLRVYEGCARNFLGTVDGATLVKLNRGEPKVSYLSYPDFDKDPHPALNWSLQAHLQTFRIKKRDFSEWENPPILHRKETFVHAEYPERDKFQRLTEAEEKAGLYEQATHIGNLNGWQSALDSKKVAIRGHRVVKAK